MKQLVLFLLLAIVTQELTAQNWAPINTTDKYNYKADTASAISHTLWVDSFGVLASDTFMFPNRVVKHISPNLALKNQPQFLGWHVTNRANGMYIMDGDSSTITYYPSAPVGASYIYDALSSPIQAYHIAVDTATVLGSLDSIKIILLSSGDTLIASKNHGFVQYPMEYGSNKYYRLVGIEGSRNLGEQVAKFEDFFNYAVGDSFWYYMDHWHIAWNEQPWQSPPVLATRYIVSIDSIFSNGDTIGLSKQGYARYSYPVGGVPYLINSVSTDVNNYPNTLVNDSMDYTYGGHLNTPTARKDYFYNTPYLSIFENTLSYPDYGREFYRGSTTYTDSLGSVVKVFDMHYTQEFNMVGDTLLYMKAQMGRKVFTSRLGVTSMSFNAFEGGARSIMCAYRLAGDSAITILDDYLFTVGVEDNIQTTNFKLLGNPVTSTIAIQLETQQPHTLTLYNLNGQHLFQQQTSETNPTMDVSQLPQGVYLLEVRNKDGVHRQRVVKM